MFCISVLADKLWNAIFALESTVSFGCSIRICFPCVAPLKYRNSKCLQTILTERFMHNLTYLTKYIPSHKVFYIKKFQVSWSSVL